MLVFLIAATHSASGSPENNAPETTMTQLADLEVKTKNCCLAHLRSTGLQGE